MTDPRYPVGEFKFDTHNTPEKRIAMINELGGLAASLRSLVRGLSPANLDTPYRSGGWTVRQLTHHLADSSLNWYSRFKMALTEQTPVIKPFDQDAWSALVDARTMPPEVSVNLLESVHARMTAVMRTLKPEDFSRTMVHPERGEISLDYTLQTLHWHTKHHIAHIERLRKESGW
jgi:uncharacterized damage-inducible protein DinB